MTKNREKIEDYYKNTKVVNKYIERRFIAPLYKVEHLKQLAILKQIIKQFQSKLLLELGPGPARLTKHIFGVKGIAIDSSRQMLNLAKKNLVGNNCWKLQQGNAFNLDFKNKSFDLVFAFRFVYHFKKTERIKLYQEIKRILKEDGIFVFEAINYKKASWIRKIVGKEKYLVYDKLYFRHELMTELEENGFKVMSLNGLIYHYWTEIIISKLSQFGFNLLGQKLIMFLDKFQSSNPYEWVAVCQKK